MGFLVDFFTTIGEIITMVIDFVIDFAKGIVQFFLDLPDYIETVTVYIDILPEAIKAIATLTLSFILIFVVIGRRGK